MTEAKHILVVDDVAVNREIAALLLEELGYQVSTAVDGQKALDWLTHNHADLILMDLVMPVMDGFESVQAIKSLTNFHNTPVVAMSGDAREDCSEKIDTAGFDDYLQKPVEPETLAAVCQRYLSGV